MRNFSKEQETLLFQYYLEGKTDYDVAHLLRVGRDRLRKWRKLNNIDSKTRSKGLSFSFCPSIIKRREKGESFTSIAISYNVSHSSIIRLLKRYQEFSVKIDKDIFSMTPDIFKALSKEEQEEYIEQAYKYYKKIGFPYISYDYNKLVGVIKSLVKYEQDIKSNVIKHCTIGANFCEHFFPHLYEASRYDRISPLMTWNDSEKLHKLIRNRFKYAPKFNGSAIRRGLKLLGGASNFKPTVAKYVYRRYLPDNGVTYDFSAGYGGRLSGFIASGKKGKYIGVDPLQKTCKGLRDLYSYWKKWVGTNSQIDIINGCAEDLELEKGIVDLAFSCPPYFKLEKYSDDSTQSINKFTLYEDWLEGFWRKVVKNCFFMLKSSGYLIYVVGNYLNYNLKKDFEEICLSEGFVKEQELQIPLSYMFLKKKTKKAFKYENMYIYRKSINKIRVPTKDDISDIVKIVRNYYKEGIMGMLPISVYHRARENGNILIYEKSGVVSGFVIFKFLKRTNKYRIIQLASKKGSFRDGIGSSLFSEIDKKGYPIILDVKKENKIAIDFYVHKGFIKVSEKKDMWILEKSN